MQVLPKHCNNMKSYFYINEVYLHREMLKSMKTHTAVAAFFVLKFKCKIKEFLL